MIRVIELTQTRPSVGTSEWGREGVQPVRGAKEKQQKCSPPCRARSTVLLEAPR